jgi:hypothetical protein
MAALVAAIHDRAAPANDGLESVLPGVHARREAGHDGRESMRGAALVCFASLAKTVDTQRTTTAVPTFTRLNRSDTSSFVMRMQPDETA